MVDPGLIEAVGRLYEVIAPTPAAFSTDELRKDREYFTGSMWRYAVTLDRLGAACGHPLHDTTVLDIGAFPGHLAAMLRRNDRANVTAVTLVTSEGFERHMRSLGVGVAVCDVECGSLPVTDHSIDVVLCCELIEHLEGDVRHILAEARRVVRDEGLLLLTTPNHASLAHRWALARGRSVYPTLDDPDYPFYAGAGVRNPMRHMREFTVGEIAALLGQARFTRISVDTVSPPLAAGRALSWRGALVNRMLHYAQALVVNSGVLIVATARP
jgi:2-polyprenyl-3-methyl-5-hydroxy-6-metoxy-1,4-benzoquinol methylase